MGLDLVEVVGVVASCFVEVVITEGLGSYGLAQKSGPSGDFRVECSLELLGGMGCDVLEDSLESFASGCGTLVDRNACGGCEQFGFGQVEFAPKRWATSITRSQGSFGNPVRSPLESRPKLTVFRPNRPSFLFLGNACHT